MNIEHDVSHKFKFELNTREEFMELYFMCMDSKADVNEPLRRKIRDEMYKIKDALVSGETEYHERIKNF